MKLKELWEDYSSLFIIFGSMGFTVLILTIGIGLVILIVGILWFVVLVSGSLLTPMVR